MSDDQIIRRHIMTYHSPGFMSAYSSGILNMLCGLSQINEGLKDLTHYQVGLIQMNVHNKIEILLGEAKHILEQGYNNPDLDDLKEFKDITSLQILMKIKDLDNYQVQLAKVIDHFVEINNKADEQIMKKETANISDLLKDRSYV